MTDEEANENTAVWLSQTNIVRLIFPALAHRLQCIHRQIWELRNLIPDACPGDAFELLWAFAVLLTFSDPFPTPCFVFGTRPSPAAKRKRPTSTKSTASTNVYPDPWPFPSPSSQSLTTGRRYSYTRSKDHHRKRESRLSSLR